MKDKLLAHGDLQWVSSYGSNISVDESLAHSSTNENVASATTSLPWVSAPR